jgi:thiol-disulfide isomerase/thioredoxin
MTKADFLEKIFDYTSEKRWKFNGSLPAIIDFYADWCGPVKQSPRYLKNFQRV